MAREALEAGTVKTEQLPPINKIEEYDGNVVVADQSAIDKEYAEELKFMEEAVTIRLEQSSEKNAATVQPAWVDGKGAEVFINGRWYPITYLPIGQTLITKRKYLEVLLRAKFTRIETKHDDATVDNPQNRVIRHTSSVVPVTIVKDTELGAEWAREILRRNL